MRRLQPAKSCMCSFKLLALAANATFQHELHHAAKCFSKSSQKELMEILLVSKYFQNQVVLDLRSGGQVNTQRKAIVQLILEKRELLVGQRVKRDGGAARGRNGNGKKAASHFEITKVSSQQVGEGGVIKGWEERTLNMSKAVRYNKDLGTFTVEKAGVYFLFCQVLFNEQQSQYVKLDVVTSGQRPQKLQCMEGYGTTPSAGPHPFHFLKPCQVSGLLRLDRGTELQAITGPSFRLHTVGNPSASPHIFSIFKVN
ncbi:tumor necrosis factor ligand superfamily member 12 isoform X1 [Notolabrus celidotus]|uniref:tumor necrosis factor ligand superfamily member 12 isoform X1 n=1 Tax=Notolabrus celidotus TaxID=1203425 RepID=UPI00148F44D4|nr:tumor necrosis factor ligand superfamily member 12 isoform X1 [Notolabrus celidotus]